MGSWTMAGWLIAGSLAALQAEAGPIDGLRAGQWYEFPNSRVAAVLPSPLPDGNPAAMVAYSGGAYDTLRHRLMIFGGGHAAYAGNEVYAFDVAAGRWSRLSDPSAAPVSVHTYDQLEYLPQEDLLFAAGGSIWGDGDATRATWLFDLRTNSWRRGQDIVGNLSDVWEFNMTTAYDATINQVLMAGYSASAGYSGATNVWTHHHNTVARDLGTTGALDPLRRQFVTIGRGRAHTHAVATNGVLGAKTALNATGATEIQFCDAPGLDYDSHFDRLVAWCRGQDVYSLNLDTRVWTRHAATNSVSPGDPTTSTGVYRGTFGRWRYMPEYNAFILYTLIDRNAFVYKLTASTMLSLADLDGDAIADATDNCSNVTNLTQLDADQDGYGNACDGDLDNSGYVTASDYTLLRSVLNQDSGSSPVAAAADMNGSGSVTTADYTLLRAQLDGAPGPSGFVP